MSIYINHTFVYWIHLPEHNNTTTQGYIGVSKNPKKRLQSHFNDARTNNHCNPYFSRILKKYNDQLTQTIIFEGEDTACYAYEEELRPSKNIGWNANKGGICPPSNKGKKHSLDHCANISKGKLGGTRSPVTAETRQKLSDANKGKIRSEESKQKIRNARKHQQFTEADKAKMSESHKGNIPGNARPITTPMGTFTSCRLGAIAYNVCLQTMINWINRKSDFNYQNT